MTHAWTVASRAVREQKIRKALEQAQGNVTHAAEALQLARSHFRYLLKQHHLVDFATELRRANGSAFGRPRK